MAFWNDLVSMGCERYSSAALENGAQVANHQAVLYGLDGRNTDTSVDCYIMVFNKATAPVSGTDTPVIVFMAPHAGTGGAGNYSYSEVVFGEKFTKGVYVLGTTTDFNGSTFTPLASNKLFIHALYSYEDGVTNPV